LRRIVSSIIQETILPRVRTMFGPDEVKIETPEQIELGLEPSGPGSRLVAWVLDALIKVGCLVVLGLLVLILGTLLGVREDAWFSGYALALALILVFGLYLAYDVFFEVRHNGQTPGKKRAGIRVIRAGGAPVDVRSAFLRSVMAFADFLPVAYLLGAGLIILTKNRQRLGDLAAGTLVIRERAVAPPAEMDQEVLEWASDEYHFHAKHFPE